MSKDNIFEFFSFSVIGTRGYVGTGTYLATKFNAKYTVSCTLEHQNECKQYFPFLFLTGDNVRAKY
jgi:hypothetical protein